MTETTSKLTTLEQLKMALQAAKTYIDNLFKNKTFLETLTGATDEEVTAMCTEVFGTTES